MFLLLFTSLVASNAAAIDVEVSIQGPTGATDTVVFRGVEPGELPGIDLPPRGGIPWSAALRLDGAGTDVTLHVVLTPDDPSGRTSPFVGVLPLWNTPAPGPAEDRELSFPPGVATPTFVVTAGIERTVTKPSEADETAATSLMTEVMDAVKANRQIDARRPLEALVSRFPETRAGKAAVRMLAELGLVGEPAAPLEVDRWLKGAAPAANTPVTLLIFTEEWCPHCRRDLPEWTPRAADLKRRGVALVVLTKLTKSSTEAKFKDWLKEAKTPFSAALERNGSMSAAFHVTGIPAAALVRNGVVIWRGHPAKLDDATLDAILAAPNPVVPAGVAPTAR